MNNQKKYDWMVCVKCYTFNHAPYIVEAMNGFTMQETDFPFVCAIVDDFSNDGEQEVIKNYLEEHFDLEDKNIVKNEDTDSYDFTFARHKTNRNCFFAVYLLRYNHYSIKKTKVRYLERWHKKAKYIAQCEGDDYWIHPKKLQKQTDYMESHNDVAMCTHAFATVTSSGRIIKLLHPKQEDGLLDVGLVIENVQAPQTASFFYRSKDAIMSPHVFYETGVGDYTRRVYSAINGGIYYIDTIMSHYRKFSSNSWTSKMTENIDEFVDHVDKMKVFAFKLDELTNGLYHINFENRIDYLVYLKNIKSGNLKIAINTNYFQSKNLLYRIKTIINNKYPMIYYNIISKFHIIFR